MELLLAKGADVNAVNKKGQTPLHEAVWEEHMAIAEFLVAKGANVDAKDKWGWTPLLRAARMGRQDIVDMLLFRTKSCLVVSISVKGVIGKDFTAEHMKLRLEQALQLGAGVLLEIDTPGGSVSHAAKTVSLMAKFKRLRPVVLVHKALSAGAPITLACSDIYVTENALIGAATAYDASGRVPKAIAEKVQSVWRAICRRAAEDGEHPSLLVEAMTNPNFALTMRLDAGKRVFERGGKGKTLKGKGELLTLTARETVACGLAKAVVKNRTAVLERLRGKKAQLIEIGRDLDGSTPLHDMARRGNKDIVELLLAKGADANAVDKDGETPLYAATSEFRGHKRVAELLIAKGANVNATNKDGRTPLHEVAQRGNKGFVELLLAKGANVKAGDKKDWTPLHAAAGRGHKDVAELLIATGANVHAKDKWGGTPLHAAAGHGHKGVAELLIAKGANVNATNKSGTTPLRFAIQEGRKVTAELLRKHGAR